MRALENLILVLALAVGVWVLLGSFGIVLWRVFWQPFGAWIGAW